MPRKFIKSLKYARAGAEHVLKTQRNIWIHCFIGLVVLAAALWLQVERSELTLLVLTIAFVLATEIINTSIEEAVNLAQPAVHPQAALAKNLAAAAVLVAAVGAIIIGGLIFLPKVWPC